MDRRFYDLDVQSDRSAGDDTVRVLARRAERLGFTDLGISDYVADPDDVGRVQDAVADAATGIDLHVGAKLRPDDPGDLKEMVREVRDEVEVLVVHGGDAAINRAATGDTRVDVLAHPSLDRNDSGLDHVMVKQAADNRVALQVNLRQLLARRGRKRAHILAHVRRALRLADHYDAPVIASSGAQSVDGLRAPRELAAFPRIFGRDVEGGFATVSDVPRSIVERAERAADDAVVRPGVTVEGDGDG